MRELLTCCSTARDALVGGMAGHIHKGHEQDRAAAGAGPGASDKTAGHMESLIGKVTGNPNKAAEGQMRSGNVQ